MASSPRRKGISQKLILRISLLSTSCGGKKSITALQRGQVLLCALHVSMQFEWNWWEQCKVVSSPTSISLKQIVHVGSAWYSLASGLAGAGWSSATMRSLGDLLLLDLAFSCCCRRAVLDRVRCAIGESMPEITMSEISAFLSCNPFYHSFNH